MHCKIMRHFQQDIRAYMHYKIMRHNIPGIPGCLGRFDLKNGGGQMKNGAATGSISHTETLLRLSPAVDSSQATFSKHWSM